MAIMYLSKETYTCPKEQICLNLTLLKQYINSFENSMNLDIKSLVNSVEPDQLASDEAS